MTEKLTKIEIGEGTNHYVALEQIHEYSRDLANRYVDSPQISTFTLLEDGMISIIPDNEGVPLMIMHLIDLFEGENSIPMHDRDRHIHPKILLDYANTINANTPTNTDENQKLHIDVKINNEKESVLFWVGNEQQWKSLDQDND